MPLSRISPWVLLTEERFWSSQQHWNFAYIFRNKIKKRVMVLSKKSLKHLCINLYANPSLHHRLDDMIFVLCLKTHLCFRRTITFSLERQACTKEAWKNLAPNLMMLTEAQGLTRRLKTEMSCKFALNPTRRWSNFSCQSMENTCTICALRDSRLRRVNGESFSIKFQFIW